MITEEEIEKLISDNLPFALNRYDVEGEKEFFDKLDSLANIAATLSEYPIRQETVRYQSMVIYISLVMAATNIFKINNVKIGDLTFAVDRTFIIIITSFVVVLLVIFLFKAYLDLQRSNFNKMKIHNAAIEIDDLIHNNGQKRLIQQYYLFELISIISIQAGNALCYAYAKSRNEEHKFEHKHHRVIILDIQALRKNTIFRETIKSAEKLLNTISTYLDNDVACFNERVDKILGDRKTKPADKFYADFDTSFAQVNDAYEACLKRWRNVSNSLVNMNTSLVLHMIRHDEGEIQAKVAISLINRMKITRRIYICIEMILPLLLSIAVVIYVWWPSSNP